MMIQVENLSKYFGPVMAIDRISFEVGRGEVVGFLGRNGAGKTTTMRILTTFMPATSGIARIDGHDVMTESKAVRQLIGYLPENVPLYPEMRVDEYILYRAKLKGVPRRDRASRLDYCLERCRLKEVSRRLLGTLSKGYRQRVGLADAMVNDPPLLILDEPTSGLDPIQIRETLSLIKDLGEKHTVLLSTHILTEVEAICERVIIIGYGKLLVNKSLEELEADAMILLEARGPDDQISAAIKHLPGVTEVQSRGQVDGLASFAIRTAEQADLRESLSKSLASKGWAVRRLERDRPLENVFFQVMRGHDQLTTMPSMTGTNNQASEAIQDLQKESIAANE